jgi:hypothetical protein
MSTPQIDTRAEIESALEDFKIFLDAGVAVYSTLPERYTPQVLGALNLVIKEFETILKPRILAA